MQPSFTILEHPSDMGIEARGATLAEAFRNAARGLMSIILDEKTIDSKKMVNIALTAIDREQLLIRFLNEVLFQYDGAGFVTNDVNFSHFSGTKIEGQLLGEPFDCRRHRPRLDVKAVTYHQLQVTNERGGARVRVFLDI